MSEPTSEDQQTDQQDPTAEDADALKSRAISAYDAFRCCQNGRHTASMALLQLGDSIVDWFAKQPREAGVNLPRIGGAIFAMFLREQQIIQLSRAQTIGTATTLFLLGSFAMPKTSGEAERQRATLRNTAEALRRTARRQCFDCVTRRIWSQDRDKFSGIWIPGRRSGLPPVRVQKRL